MKQNALEDNTVIVFTSDNGGLSLSSDRPTSNLPLRAGKGWPYEGGIRVPWIIVVPGMTKKGSTNDTPITSTDLYSTLLDLANQARKPEQHQDGISLVPIIQGGAIAPRLLYWHYPYYGAQHGAPFGAIRDGDWKLIEWYEDSRLELYNLRDDLKEKTNLAVQELSKAQALHENLIEWRKEVSAVMPTRNKD